MKFIEGKKYVTNKGDIAICQEILHDGSMIFKINGEAYAFDKGGNCYYWNERLFIVSEYVEPAKFDWTKPARTKNGKEVLYLTKISPDIKYGLVGLVAGDSQPSFWDKNGVSVTNYNCDSLENIPQKRTVPLEPGDIKSSYLLRHKNEPEWCWRKVDGVKKDKHGVPIVLYSGSSVNFRAMFDHWLISKDGGKTWERCEKEVVS